MEAPLHPNHGHSMAAPPVPHLSSNYLGLPSTHAKGHVTRPRTSYASSPKVSPPSDPLLSTWDNIGSNNNRIPSLAALDNACHHSPYITKEWLEDPAGPPYFLAFGARLGAGHPGTSYHAGPAWTVTSASEVFSHQSYTPSYTTEPTEPSYLGQLSPERKTYSEPNRLPRNSARQTANRRRLSRSRSPPRRSRSPATERRFRSRSPPRRSRSPATERRFRPNHQLRNTTVPHPSSNSSANTRSTDYYTPFTITTRDPSPHQEVGSTARPSPEADVWNDPQISPTSQYLPYSRPPMQLQTVSPAEVCSYSSVAAEAGSAVGDGGWHHGWFAPDTEEHLPCGSGKPHGKPHGTPREREECRAPHERPRPVPSTACRNAQTTSRVHRPFYCTLFFAGCTQTFATKNEWKRHVATQHIQHKIWRCDFPSCNERKAATFNRKDLFGQHLKRMHGPEKAKPCSGREKPKSPALLQFLNTELPRIQDRCCIINRPLPERSSCGFCDDKEFHGDGSWEDRMEHVGRHYENAIADQKNVGPSAWKPDHYLIEYALREGLVTLSNGTYTLVNNSGKEQVTEART